MDDREARQFPTPPAGQSIFPSPHNARPLARTEVSLAARALATLDRLRGTLSWISDRGGVIAGADTLAAFLGRAPSDLSGASWLSALDPAERRSIAREWERSLEERAPDTMLWRFLRADGMIAPMRVTIQPMTALKDETPLWLCVAQPAIAEPLPERDRQRVNEDDESGRSNAARMALDSMADGFFGLDNSGRFVFANTSARACFAADGMELVGREYTEALPALRGSLLDDELQRIGRERTPGIVETFIPQTQTWFEVRTYPTPSGCAAHMRDVAYRRSVFDRLDAALKSAETARADAEARAHELDATIESVVDGLIVYNANGVVQHANRAMRALWSMLGENDPATLSVHPPQDVDNDRPHDVANQPASLVVRQALWHAWRRIISGESLADANSLDVSAHVSEEITLELSVCGGPVFGERGEIIGAVETVRDVSIQRQGERERVRTLSFVAHELLTPLTSIKLSLDLAIRRFAKNKPIEPPALAVATDGIQQIERMVEDLVDAARSDNQKLRLKRERCDLREICAQAVKEQAAATGRQTLYDEPPEPLWINADYTRIHQVLSNLLSNALKYSPIDTPVELHVERRDGQVWAGVRDQGPGVPPEAQPKLFQAFYRAPGAQALHGPNVGLGLGLFLCKRLVELHSGQIGFTSEQRKGSLFWFSLPLAEESNLMPEAVDESGET